MRTSSSRSVPGHRFKVSCPLASMQIAGLNLLGSTPPVEVAVDMCQMCLGLFWLAAALNCGSVLRLRLFWLTCMQIVLAILGELVVAAVAVYLGIHLYDQAPALSVDDVRVETSFVRAHIHTPADAATPLLAAAGIRRGLAYLRNSCRRTNRIFSRK